MATAEVGPGPSSDAILAEKIAWASSMRQQFSPAGMCNADGSINQDFFKPKKIIIQLTEDKKWGQPERDALYKVNYITAAPSTGISSSSNRLNCVFAGLGEIWRWEVERNDHRVPRTA